ncbi:TonB-dependent receptor [Saccharobesus litoralis]|uniref:TonB-dependent receptor n=1 Tax=Saccharobesus litoralis TaxID=2172099 RepID=A0A2S0VPJ3_9ALTE|nr:TonB-dependent receptor [Saccharobesus litoralis]AWB66141.1 TonB-dependent receptor [Saccharobesus litoralis]
MSLTTKTNKLAALPLAITAALTTPVLADNTEQESSVEKIQIVGKTSNTEITVEQLENYIANDLEDIFRHVPSVTIGGSLGVAQKMFVRGVEDTLLNVTVDGAPQASTLFHHTGRLSIEPELLRSVEVQAGAGEATAGAGSIGGAIRFKTKSADDLLEAEQTFGGLVKAGYFTNGGQKQSLSLYGKVADKVGILGSFVKAKRDNIEDGDGNTIPGTESDQSLAFIKFNAQVADNQELTLSYENREEDGEFPKQTNWNPLATTAFTQTWLDRETIILNYTANISDFVNIEATIYDTESELKRELYTWSGAIKTKGFDLRNTSQIGEHTLTYGLEKRTDTLLAQSYSDSFGGIFNEEGKVAGLYIQDQWQVLDDLLLSFGLRKDSYELDHCGVKAVWEKVDGKWRTKTDENGDPVTSSAAYAMPKQDGISKNLGLVYNLTDNLAFSAGYAEALRGRLTTDAFVVGELSQGLNTELQPEQVKNKEIGLEYNDGTLIFELSGYQSDIENVVFDKFKGGTFYENIGTLASQGVEIVAGYQADNFQVVLSYNNNDVVLDDAEFNWPDSNSDSGFSVVKLNGVDLEAYEYGHLGNGVGDSINLNFHYEVNQQIELGYNFNYVQSLDNVNVFYRSIELGWVDELNTINKPSYKVHDVFVKYQATDNLTFDFSVQNLLDESYLSHGSVANYGHITGYETVVGIKEPGRDIRLSASFKF